VARLATVTGSLDAAIGVAGACVHAKAPLELRGPFPDASYFLRNVTAGIFGGDAYEVDVRVTAGSTVRVASSSATKVYGGNGEEACLTVRLGAETGATLLWGPHATIVQGGSSFRQQTTLDVATGGRAVLGEILVLGRLAHGERFVFERLESSLDVRLDGTPVYSEAYRLTPGPDLVASMAGHGVLASVYLVGVNESAIDFECALTDESLVGWSTLPNNAGVVVRGLFDSLSLGQQLVERVMRAFSDGAC